MAKMQPVNFKHVDEFLDYIPEKERVVVDFLREIVFDCIPDAREKLSYNVPYYSRNKRICFIWPSSVPWGKVKKEGVMFGFCTGHLLTDDIGFLEKGDRKIVYTKTYFAPEEVEVDLLKSFILEAVELDRQTSGKRK